MKLRIVVGKNLVSKFKRRQDLSVFYQSASVLIQGDSAVRLIKQNGQPRGFLMGQVVGVKENVGKIPLFNRSVLMLNNFISAQPLVVCMKQIEGRFILIKLGESGACEIGCDHYGQMDLYYQQIGEEAIFASSLDLLPFKEGPVEYDQVAVAHTLYVYGFRPAKRQTLYQNVKRLDVGETAVWKHPALTFYQNPPTIVKTKEWEQAELIQYKDILLDAVASRSSPHGNIVYLSSGWDSTALLACLVKLHGPKKVRAVIGRMHFSERSGVCNPFEIKRAKAVADYFKVPLEIVEFDYFRRGPEITERMKHLMQGQMATSMAFYQWVDLADYVAKTSNGEAVFSGEISDGVHNFGFSQMMTVLDHPSHRFREYADKMASYLYSPTFLQLMQAGRADNDCIYNFLKERQGEGLFDHLDVKVENRSTQLLASLFIRNNRFPLWSLKNSKIFTAVGRELYDREMREMYLKVPAKNITPETLYAWYIHLYNSFHWNGGTVSTLYMTADEHGFDMQLPFRDSRIIELLSTMPESYGRGLEMKPTKYPLKWMLEHHTIDYPLHLQVGPHSYTYDVDSTFSHTAEWIYRSAFTPQYIQMMKKRNYRKILSPVVFDLKYFDQIVDHYLEGKEVLSERGDLESLVYFSAMGWY